MGLAMLDCLPVRVDNQACSAAQCGFNTNVVCMSVHFVH